MIKLLFPGFLAMALIHGGPASHAVAANDPAGRISCVTRGDSVVIDFGISKRPTNFAVITPGDEFLYIVYPKLGIDNMAQHPDRTGKVSLPISTQQGTRLGSKEDEQVRVFGSAGHYKLIFQDANTTEFEAPHSFQCSVRLSALTDPDHMAKAQACRKNGNPPPVGSPATVATSVIAREADVPIEALRDIGLGKQPGLISAA